MAVYAVPILPPGSEVVVMASAALIVMLSAAVAVPGVGAVESVTFTVKLDVPVALGVPEIAPVVEFKVKPVGNVPTLMLQA